MKRDCIRTCEKTVTSSNEYLVLHVLRPTGTLTADVSILTADVSILCVCVCVCVCVRAYVTEAACARSRMYFDLRPMNVKIRRGEARVYGIEMMLALSSE